jgi:hypothetical protein
MNPAELAVALNLHDFYGGLERIFQQIATSIDRSTPTGGEWHRELLAQTATAVPRLRPAVLSAETVRSLDGYRGFGHVVRNIYTFDFDHERIDQLAVRLRATFEQARLELQAFAAFLEDISVEDSSGDVESAG